MQSAINTFKDVFIKYRIIAIHINSKTLATTIFINMKIITLIFCLLLVFEIGSRAVYRNKYGSQINVFYPDFVKALYPELKKVSNKKTEVSVLILGESMTESSLLTSELKRLLEEHGGKKVYVDNLSHFANSIIDSYFKYSRVKKKYDYVILSAGIYDCCMNYNPYALEGDNYYFSKEFIFKKILMKHTEARVTVLPMTVDFLWNKSVYFLKGYYHYERQFYSQHYRIKSEYYPYGDKARKNNVFKTNLEKIIKIANDCGSKLILLPANFYVCAGYEEKKYLSDSLDYSGGGIPAEIYGSPKNLEKIADGIKQMMFEKEGHGVQVADIKVAPCKKNYKDICHFTSDGMMIFSEAVAKLIRN
jgi:hypothetical protein